MSLNIEYTIDEKTYRRSINGFGAVTQSYHYMTLLTKLALQLSEFGGPQILADSAEDAMRPLFDDYYSRAGLTAPAERFQVGRDFYALLGLGLMELEGDRSGGRVTLSKSHVDQGWLLRQGKNDRPVNHLTRGFIAALFAATFDLPAQSYGVEETAGLVQGESLSRFTVKAK
ncbi:MAG: hypothetical protein V1816_20550 [Pseudomonadota bacterium]